MMIERATNVGSTLRHARLALGMTAEEAAIRAGFTDPAEGAARVLGVEATGVCNDDLLQRLAEACGLEYRLLSGAAGRDEELLLLEFFAWASAPETARLESEVAPGVAMVVPVPRSSRTREEAEAFASRWARDNRRGARLVLSPTRATLVDEAGRVYARVEADPPARD